jgi:hypothetical protein
MRDDDSSLLYKAGDLIEAIIEHCEENGLDADFAESIEEQIAEKNWVSEAQLSALEKIADKFDIPY